MPVATAGREDPAAHLGGAHPLSSAIVSTARSIDATRAPGQALACGALAPRDWANRPQCHPLSSSLRGSQLWPTVPHDRGLQRDGGDQQSGVTDEQAGAALGGLQAKHQHRAVSGRKRRDEAEFACATTADEAISGGPL
ncbi:hypothetical protein MKX08_004500 [Trichoderma sp. CBMAI-0020]|nr:hypothetical protein MKX08_004500 [Trichoderma sp. CBMAI-0020]